MRVHDRGFTLIEVLIAMAITAVIAVLAYQSLSAVLSGADRVRAQASELHELTRAFNLLSRDLRQVVNRPVRDEFGANRSALEGGMLAREMLSLTRAGWHNSADLPRSTLERVAYYLEDENLIRASWNVLDRTGNSEPRETVLLEQVEAFEVYFLPNIESLEVIRDLDIDRRSWLDNWLADISQPDSLIDPPAAVAIKLRLAGWGELERLYVLPPY